MSTIEKKAVLGGKYATKQEVDTFIRGYKTERWADNTEKLGQEDALSSWYTIDELENFIERVKLNGGNGVRMHFGVFPEGYGDEKVEGLQTIVLVGTRSKDGTFATSKQLHVQDGENTEVLAYLGGIPCPAYCPTPGSGFGFGGLGISLVERGDKGLSIV